VGPQGSPPPHRSDQHRTSSAPIFLNSRFAANINKPASPNDLLTSAKPFPLTQKSLLPAAGRPILADGQGLKCTPLRSGP
jgi:hypothetical protein